MSKLYLGIGREIITPLVGGHLYGYSDSLFSTGVHDDLTVDVMAFKSDKTEFILISCTLCAISTILSERLRREVSEATGVASENIMVTCTHTHSGPPVSGSAGWGEADMGYFDDVLRPNVLKATKTAMEKKIAVKVGVGTTESKVGINRMVCDIDDNITLGQCPYGIYDPIMTVISFCDKNEKPVLNIVHYGAHCTAAGAITEISRDWAGVMVDRMEKETGATTVFLLGPEGDVGPRLSNGSTAAHFTGDPDISYAMEIGSVAAVDAVRAFRNIKTYREEKIDAVSDKIHLPYAQRISLEEAKDKLENYEPTLPYENCQKKERAYFENVIKAWENNHPILKEKVIEQTLFKIGNVVIVPFPFEAFSEIGLRLREYSPYEHTLSVCNSNGSYAYLPSQKDLCRGGYEIFQFMTSGIQRLADDTDKNIIKENIRIMKNFK